MPWQHTAAPSCARKRPIQTNPNSTPIRISTSQIQIETRCDEYFLIGHRGETRGLGGIFFDDLNDKDPDTILAFSTDAVNSVVDAYCPLVRKHKDDAFTEEEKRWQQVRARACLLGVFACGCGRVCVCVFACVCMCFVWGIVAAAVAGQAGRSGTIRSAAANKPADSSPSHHTV